MPAVETSRTSIPPFYVMEVMRAAEEREISGADVLHLEVGQPSTGAPAGVVACFEPGDRLAVASPGYRDMLRSFGVDVIDIAVGPADRFQPSPEALDTAGPLHWLVVASPSNPTGTMLAGSATAELAD